MLCFQKFCTTSAYKGVAWSYLYLLQLCKTYKTIYNHFYFNLIFILIFLMGDSGATFPYKYRTFTYTSGSKMRCFSHIFHIYR